MKNKQIFFIWIFGIIGNNFIDAEEFRTAEVLAEKFKTIAVENVQQYMDTLPIEEQKILTLYVLNRYQKIIVQNVKQNPLTYVSKEKAFLRWSDVPESCIELIGLSRSCAHLDVKTKWKSIKGLCKGLYDDRARAEYLQFERSIPFYYRLLVSAMRKRGLTNFSEFLEEQINQDNLFVLLSELLYHRHKPEIPLTVLNNEYIKRDFREILFMKHKYVAQG